ncbi:ABC transporter [Paenibacillus selenitireducens]|uniref:Autoinducer 2 import ATP-binding protein LsrA n=1 Tax=Paenibacillus selenitireducens TaxID=1324314 RepID=A0A1T2XNS6_9BACL|nr:sugar ABC transporter ATP-binding protein [Paenibacillus selenitireducens]OPA81435.1 ABC transporter [Paenibacillus selenitireducens]
MTANQEELRLEHITKSFAGVPALKSVDFTVHRGEIHALLGANGAGKSTLMKILSGAYTLDAGTITIGPREVKLHSPSDAKKNGIHCVYQEVDTALVPQITVAENILLDRLSTREGGLWHSWGQIYREAEEAIAKLGASIDVRKKVEGLSLSEKQLVLIARTLVEKAKFIIFDEPTAPLSHEETTNLFRVMKQMKAEGIGCIFISHRLPEVFEHCDRVTVMRDGQQVYTESCEASSMDEVIRHMLGKTFEEEFPKRNVPIGEVILQTDQLTSGTRVKQVDMQVRSGEIVSVVGLVGAGKSELSNVLFGALRRDQGHIFMHGRKLSVKNPSDAIEAGIVLVPEERRKHGIMVEDSVQQNLSLPLLRQLSRIGFVRGRREQEHAQRLVDRLGVKTSSLKQQVKFLSGGNQQKVAIGKWVETKADVFLFDEPTKGVDIGAKSDIFRLIGDLAHQGKGILYFTCEFAEAIGIADRILVMCEGRVVKEFSRDEATQEKLLYYASAGQEDES